MFARVRKLQPSVCSILALVSLLGSTVFAAGQTKGPTPANPQPASGMRVADYQIKRSDVVVPADVPLGQYRRMTQPFANWTLICDENLAKKQKVCNISQTIVDRQGGTVFSWSLAAAEDGRPFFILRVPSAVGNKGSIRLKLPDRQAEVAVPVEGCTANVCIGYQQVGPRFRAAVEKEGAVGVSYSVSPAQTVSFSVPLKGLNEALASI